MRTRRVVAVALFLLLLTPLTAPAAGEWEEDIFLSEVIGPERLAAGDEYGCHGIPGKDIREDHSAIRECKDYLTERTVASQWGAQPLSFGVPGESLDQETGDALVEQGFMIIGDKVLTGHEHLIALARNGGSLEKNIGSVTEFEQALDSPAYVVNLYWIPRMNLNSVRPDWALVDAIESSDAWFATWGEVASYNRHQPSLLWEADGNTAVLTHAPVAADPLTHPESQIGWTVPYTLGLEMGDSVVMNIENDGVNMSELTADDRHLTEGWRMNGTLLLLTLKPGYSVTIHFDGAAPEVLSSNHPQWFNDHDEIITVAGHHVDDLFDASRRWDDTPMRFTWLVEPRGVEQNSWWLPVIAVFVALATPAAIIWTVRRDRNLQRVLFSLDGLHIPAEEE
uniref:Uncharacterized protein n=1 Tax=uncultured marine group II/III euryarchaeote KM3_64_C08 TaxID=1456479 RepID=A0A075HF34_9EURY|nr:hypothetical protein [uncultured marine group II/III euryarchaeote KM3_64_C08]